jgi:hypothetical protein
LNHFRDFDRSPLILSCGTAPQTLPSLALSDIALQFRKPIQFEIWNGMLKSARRGILEDSLPRKSQPFPVRLNFLRHSEDFRRSEGWVGQRARTWLTSRVAKMNTKHPDVQSNFSDFVRLISASASRPSSLHGWSSCGLNQAVVIGFYPRILVCFATAAGEARISRTDPWSAAPH